MDVRRSYPGGTRDDVMRAFGYTPLLCRGCQRRSFRRCADPPPERDAPPGGSEDTRLKRTVQADPFSPHVFPQADPFSPVFPVFPDPFSPVFPK